MASGLNLLLVILPLLCNGLLPNETFGVVETPLCDEQLQNRYCDASYGGDFHTGCRFCGVGPQCPSNKPSARGLKNKPDLRAEILQRHNLYRSVVRSGATNLPPTKCLPELRWDDELSEVAQVWADQCAGVIYQHSTDSYPKIFHERGSERMTSKFSAPPGVGQNVAWALTKTVNFTKIIDDLWYRDITKLQPGYIDDFQVQSANQNVHLVTQMIWGRTTHVGCGWIQFPVESGSNKFHKIYPEGEYENFFVCNYGVGGNVPGQPVYNTDCEEKHDEVDDNSSVHLDVSDLDKKVDQVFGDADPQRKTLLQICLDALMCLHSQENQISCRNKEQKCIQMIEPGDSLINPNTYFANSAGTRTDMLQCTTESIFCSMKARENCAQNLTLCFDEIENEVVETTTTRGTTQRPSPTISVRTSSQEVTIQAETTLSSSTSSSNFIIPVTTATFFDLDVEVTTTFKPFQSQSVSNNTESKSETTQLPLLEVETTIENQKGTELVESRTEESVLPETGQTKSSGSKLNTDDDDFSPPTNPVAETHSELPSTTTITSLRDAIPSENVTEKVSPDESPLPGANKEELVDEEPKQPDEISSSDTPDFGNSDEEDENDENHLKASATFTLDDDPEDEEQQSFPNPELDEVLSGDGINQPENSSSPSPLTTKPEEVKVTTSTPFQVTTSESAKQVSTEVPESKSSLDVELPQENNQDGVEDRNRFITTTLRNLKIDEIELSKSTTNANDGKDSSTTAENSQDNEFASSSEFSDNKDETKSDDENSQSSLFQITSLPSVSTPKDEIQKDFEVTQPSVDFTSSIVSEKSSKATTVPTENRVLISSTTTPKATENLGDKNVEITTIASSLTFDVEVTPKIGKVEQSQTESSDQQVQGKDQANSITEENKGDLPSNEDNFINEYDESIDKEEKLPATPVQTDKDVNFDPLSKTDLQIDIKKEDNSSNQDDLGQDPNIKKVLSSQEETIGSSTKGPQQVDLGQSTKTDPLSNDKNENESEESSVKPPQEVEVDQKLDLNTTTDLPIQDIKQEISTMASEQIDQDRKVDLKSKTDLVPQDGLEESSTKATEQIDQGEKTDLIGITDVLTTKDNKESTTASEQVDQGQEIDTNSKTNLLVQDVESSTKGSQQVNQGQEANINSRTDSSIDENGKEKMESFPKASDQVEQDQKLDLESKTDLPIQDNNKESSTKSSQQVEQSQIIDQKNNTPTTIHNENENVTSEDISTEPSDKDDHGQNVDPNSKKDLPMTQEESENKSIGIPSIFEIKRPTDESSLNFNLDQDLPQGEIDENSQEQSTSRSFSPQPTEARIPVEKLDENSFKVESKIEETEIDFKNTTSKEFESTTAPFLLSEENENFVDMEKFKDQIDKDGLKKASDSELTTISPLPKVIIKSSTNTGLIKVDELIETGLKSTDASIDSLLPNENQPTTLSSIEIGLVPAMSTTLNSVDEISQTPLIDELQGEKRTNPEETFSFGIAKDPISKDGVETLKSDSDISPITKQNTTFSTFGVTTSTANPVTSIIDFLTTFETPISTDEDALVDVSFYNSTAKTSFRLALCLDGMHCKEDDLRCSILHKECNEGLNIEKLPFQVRKKLSECTVDDILCHLDENVPNEKSCQYNYERCINIVIPESLLSTVSLQPSITNTEVAIIPDEADMNPFFTLLSISKLSGTLKENESKFLANISSNVLKAIESSVGHSVEAVSLNSSDELNDWLLQKDTLPIFTDITIIIPEEEVGTDENSTAIAHPENIDFDLTNSTLIFDPTTLVIGNVDAKDAQIISKEILNSLKDQVNICHNGDCNSEDDPGDIDYFTNEAVFEGVTAKNPESRTEMSKPVFDKELDAFPRPGLSYAEIQIHLTNCLAGASCTDPVQCPTAQEKCIGKSNAMKYSKKSNKQFCECVVDFLLCSLNNASNVTLCEANVDSCLTMVIIVNGVSKDESIPTTSTQRSFPIANKTDTIFDDIIETIAKNITNLVQENESLMSENIKLRVQNNLTLLVDENTPIFVTKPDEVSNAIVLTSLTPQIQFKPIDRDEIVIDTSDLAKESTSDRQKITQKRIENVLRQITGDFHFVSLNNSPFETTSKSNAAITMSASTAFEDENLFQPTTENVKFITLQPPLSTLRSKDKEEDEVVLDFNVTINDHSLFEVVSSAVATYVNPMEHKPDKIIFTVEKTQPTFEPVIMIQIAQFDDNVIVNLKISNETVNSTIFQVPVKDASDQEVIQTEKLSSIIEESIMHSSPQKVKLTPEEIAEVITTFIDVNVMKEIDLDMKTSLVEVTVDNNSFTIESTESFQRDEHLHLDLSNLPHLNPMGGIAEEVKEVVLNILRNNLQVDTDGPNDKVQLQVEEPFTDADDVKPPTDLFGNNSNDGIITFPVFGFNISSEQNFTNIDTIIKSPTSEMTEETPILPSATAKNSDLDLVKKLGQAESKRDELNSTLENPTEEIVYSINEAEEIITEMSVKMNVSATTKLIIPGETSTAISLEDPLTSVPPFFIALPINDSSIIEHQTKPEGHAEPLPVTPYEDISEDTSDRESSTPRFSSDFVSIAEEKVGNKNNPDIQASTLTPLLDQDSSPENVTHFSESTEDPFSDVKSSTPRFSLEFVSIAEEKVGNKNNPDIQTSTLTPLLDQDSSPENVTGFSESTEDPFSDVKSSTPIFSSDFVSTGEEKVGNKNNPGIQTSTLTPPLNQDSSPENITRFSESNEDPFTDTLRDSATSDLNFPAEKIEQLPNSNLEGEDLTSMSDEILLQGGASDSKKLPEVTSPQPKEVQPTQDRLSSVSLEQTTHFPSQSDTQPIPLVRLESHLAGDRNDLLEKMSDQKIPDQESTSILSTQVETETLSFVESLNVNTFETSGEKAAEDPLGSQESTTISGGSVFSGEETSNLTVVVSTPGLSSVSVNVDQKGFSTPDSVSSKAPLAILKETPSKVAQLSEEALEVTDVPLRSETVSAVEENLTGPTEATEDSLFTASLSDLAFEKVSSTGEPFSTEAASTSTEATDTGSSEGFFSNGFVQSVRDILLTLAAGLMTQAIAFPVLPGRRGDAAPTRFQGQPIIKDPSIRQKIREEQLSFSGNTLNLTLPLPPHAFDTFPALQQNLTDEAREAFSPDVKVHDVGIFVDTTDPQGSIVITAQRDPPDDDAAAPLLPSLPLAPSEPSFQGVPQEVRDVAPQPRPLAPTPSLTTGERLNPREPWTTAPESRATPFLEPVPWPSALPGKTSSRVPPTPSSSAFPPAGLLEEKEAVTLRALTPPIALAPRIPIPVTDKPLLETANPSLGAEGDTTLDLAEADNEDLGLVVRPVDTDEDFFGAISNDATRVFDSRINVPGGSSANVVQATVVEDLNYARSVRDSSIGIATISSITVGVIALLGFGLLIFLALARRRRQRRGDSSTGSPIVTPTQSRTTFSGSPLLGGDTPSVSDTRGFLDDAVNTSSSAGSSLDPVLPIDGRGTIVTSYDDYLSLPETARGTLYAGLTGSGPGSAAGPSPLPPPLLTEGVSRTRDLPEHPHFLFARRPPGRPHHFDALP